MVSSDNNKPLYKRLVVLCDGTWLDSLTQTTVHPSNVARLSRAISTLDTRNDNNVQQVVFYQEGVGSTGILLVDKVLGGAFGTGILYQMRQAYAFIALNHSKGDEVFFIGFSRGAYMVRALCGFMMDFGLLTKDGMSNFDVCFDAYMRGGLRVEHVPGSYDLIAEKQKLHKEKQLKLPEDVTVQAIGCFDTVGALGPLPSHYAFLDQKLSPLVKHAFHALSLDETRRLFKSTLWFFPKDGNHPPDKFKQVWFNGMHLNVGGGDMNHVVNGTNLLDPANGNPNVLSDGPLIWMATQLQLLLKIDWDYLKQTILPGNSEGDQTLRIAAKIELTNKLAYYRGPFVDNYAGLIGILYRILGKKSRCYNSYMPEIRIRQQNIGEDQATVTNEFVHESVSRRFLISKIKNPPLQEYSLVLPSLENTENETVQSVQSQVDGKSVDVALFEGCELEFWSGLGVNLRWKPSQ
ncbi:hypothetical protein V1514DRAFT_333158 [Lipomyces japonicus]|uniref:uncharacterized protein n=1 Tax=Lipomyces japonicus TaxID=56871 RepID=UPI0034CD8911